jgi:hypothetical protein
LSGRSSGIYTARERDRELALSALTPADITSMRKVAVIRARAARLARRFLAESH